MFYIIMTRSFFGPGKVSMAGLRYCAGILEQSMRGLQEPSRNMVIFSAHQATQAGGINSLESLTRSFFGPGKVSMAGLRCCAEILEQSMEARNRVGIVTQLHMLAESIPGLKNFKNTVSVCYKQLNTCMTTEMQDRLLVCSVIAMQTLNFSSSRRH